MKHRYSDIPSMASRVDRIITNCPKCQEPITAKQIAQVMRAIPSEARSKASRENGKKGGRPKKVLDRV